MKNAETEMLSSGELWIIIWDFPNQQVDGLPSRPPDHIACCASPSSCDTCTKSETQWLVAGAILNGGKFSAIISRSSGNYPITVTTTAKYDGDMFVLKKAFDRVNAFFTQPATKHQMLNASQSALQNYITPEMRNMSKSVTEGAADQIVVIDE